jgi:hypothetical protein
MSEQKKYEVLSAIDEAVCILHRGEDSVDNYYKAETVARLVSAYQKLKASKIYFQTVMDDSMTIH